METLARAANRGSVSTGYNINNSLKLEPDNTEKIYRPSGLGASVTSTQGTISYWHKGTELGSGTTWHWVDGTATQNHYASINGNDVFYIAGRNESSYKLLTNRVFKDTSAWYHFVIAYDTTQATASNRIKLYVNGVQETDFSTETYPAQNLDLRFLTVNGQTHIGNNTATSSRAGYYTEIYFLDGQTLAPTDFGEFDEDTGIWKPKQFTGSFGSNDYYLDFESSGSLGADASGNSNNFTLNNVTSADQATDTPTNNFCIINPLFKYPSSQVISEGNTEITRTSGTGHNKIFYATMPVGSGKWYAEFEPQVTNGIYGVCTQERPSTTVADNSYIGNTTGDVAYYYSDGNKYVSGTSTSYGSSYAAGDVMGIALDMDNRYVYFSKNGTWQNSGDPTSGASGTGGLVLPDADENYMMAISYSTGGNWYANWGGYTLISIASGNADANGYGNFEYAPPSGYYALCTKNLAEYG